MGHWCQTPVPNLLGQGSDTGCPRVDCEEKAMMEKNAKIYDAGHRGMVGSAIVRELKRQGYENIITRTHKELEDRKSTRLNSSHKTESRMPSSA